MIVDWNKFAERVPAGTFIRVMREDVVHWQGITLETYPYRKEEIIPYIGIQYELQWTQTVIDDPQIECQGFEQLLSVPIWILMPTVQFLVAKQWQTFAEVMA